MIRRVLPACAFAVAVLAPALDAQTLRGLLLERDADRPINIGTIVMITERGDTVAASLTDESGYFSVSSPDDGIFFVFARALGYRPGRAGPFALDENAEHVVQLTLVPQPIALEGLDVETAPAIGVESSLISNGFYERMQARHGQFLTPEDIANSDARFTPHLLRGLEHVEPQYGAAPWKIWVRFRSLAGSGTCVPRVYVDNVWVNRWPVVAEVFSLDDVVSIYVIQAVEVYAGPFQAPVKYQGVQNDCGVILFWTINAL